MSVLKRNRLVITISIVCLLIVGSSTYRYRYLFANRSLQKTNVMSADSITRECLLALHEHATEYARSNAGVFPTTDQLCETAAILNPLYKDRNLPNAEVARCCRQLLHNLRITYHVTKSNYRPVDPALSLFSSVVVSDTVPDYELSINVVGEITERLQQRKDSVTLLMER